MKVVDDAVWFSNKKNGLSELSSIKCNRWLESIRKHNLETKIIRLTRMYYVEKIGPGDTPDKNFMRALSDAMTKWDI